MKTMNLQEIRAVVEGTADAAFAVDGSGAIIAWNRAAAALMGISFEQAIGSLCADIIHGTDECGPICSEHCSVRLAIQKNNPVSNYDALIPTTEGRKWVNISTLIAPNPRSTYPYSIHIMRLIDAQKRLEISVRHFVKSESEIPLAMKEAQLTPREKEILKLMATGAKSAVIAKELHVSRITLNNHVQHIFKKLNCHTRLEAIRRAERARLI